MKSTYELCHSDLRKYQSRNRDLGQRLDLSWIEKNYLTIYTKSSSWFAMATKNTHIPYPRIHIRQTPCCAQIDKQIVFFSFFLHFFLTFTLILMLKKPWKIVCYKVSSPAWQILKKKITFVCCLSVRVPFALLIWDILFCLFFDPFLKVHIE